MFPLMARRILLVGSGYLYCLPVFRRRRCADHQHQMDNRDDEAFLTGRTDCLTRKKKANITVTGDEREG